MLREAVKAESELGRTARSYMEQGSLVPDDLVIRILVERISQPDAREGFILDGFPRNVPQAVALDEALSLVQAGIDLTINLVAPEDELVRRLSARWVCPNCGAIYHLLSQPPRKVGECDDCGSQLVQRDDDKPETARARLEKQRTPAGLLEHYRKKGKLVEIDGAQPVQKVTQDVVKIVEAMAARSVN